MAARADALALDRGRISTRASRGINGVITMRDGIVESQSAIPPPPNATAEDIQ